VRRMHSWRHYGLLSVLALACAQRAPRADALRIAQHLVGVWATDSATFNTSGGIVTGTALYLYADGTGALIGAPPPIGMAALATFDARTKLLSATLLDADGQTEIGEEQFAYDSAAGTLLRLGGDIDTLRLRRRQREVPSFVKAMMCEGSKASRVCSNEP
jgi:hypothetical protein